MTDTKIALVTGANKGIGKEIVRQLLAAGVTAIVGARDPERGRKAAEELGTTSVVMDVTDQASVDAAAKTVEQQYGRLDILMNNAGVALDWGRERPSELSADVVREIYETNVFGVIRVTNAFLPLLRKSERPRIVNTSSSLASVSLQADPDSPQSGVLLLGYNSSKSALNAVSLSYANDLRAEGITVNVFEPGFCSTDLNDHAGQLDPAQGAAVGVAVALAPGEGGTAQFHAEGGFLPW
ncbi:MULTISPECIES: SDR family NAD(P)-dependent oxidoreductase [Amycolatopsis]|uniref:SDR family NAD(P)-dependent oxidoreductase n=1 Tax=Amycolatopsis thermalba TaxID=944492 RepID=A0ABY4NR66_9PSEU|nr:MULTISPECIES: SDR family NAD(P)-dependent oxidoreductase [Amycolatopsis]OXM73800.1 dehydrogenase [Amycolatopsis sp. KNN50.9b]UQS22547.1 SDR family NAD(P)-dependent oxidoreductase [Amycolatopsis thermalba]